MQKHVYPVHYACMCMKHYIIVHRRSIAGIVQGFRAQPTVIRATHHAGPYTSRQCVALTRQLLCNILFINAAPMHKIAYMLHRPNLYCIEAASMHDYA